MKSWVLLMGLGLLTLLHAQSDESRFQLSGFGAFGMIYNTDSDYYFRPDYLSLNGSDGNVDTKADTLLGAQADYQINERFALGLQGVLRPGDENDPDDPRALNPALEKVCNTSDGACFCIQLPVEPNVSVSSDPQEGEEA